MPKYLDMHGLETLTGEIKNTYLKKNQRGAAGGVASLNSSGKVPSSQLPELSGGVQDVSYKGTSLVDQTGTADIPPAQTSIPGLAMVGAGYGLKAADPNGNSAGRLSTDAATSSHIRFFTDQYRPITPYYLPEAVFRGLAKVAGDDTQTDSQNPVGTYTDDAQAAIQEMLNVPDKTDTVLNTTLSRGRTPNSTVGDGSIAFGYMVEASGSQSVGFGSLIEAKGNQSFAHGYEVVARGARSSAGGYGTIAQGVNSDVSGMHNVADSYENWPDWQPNTYYNAKDKIHLQVQSGGETYDYYYICNTPHTSGTTWDSHSSYWDNDNGKMNYAHIVGNGKDYRHRSNAYALDWEGNGHYAGDVYVGCNANGSGGVKLEPVVFATDSEIQDIIDEWEVSA